MKIIFSFIAFVNNFYENTNRNLTVANDVEIPPGAIILALTTMVCSVGALQSLTVTLYVSLFVAGPGKKVKDLMPEFIEGENEKSKKLDGKMWKTITKYQSKGGTFWYDCPPMVDAFILWDFITSNFKNVEILTACGEDRFNAGPQKLKWVAKYFGSDIKVNLVRRSVDKANFATPNSILIDDKPKALNPFIEAGGMGVLHTSAADSIEQIKKILKL